MKKLLAFSHAGVLDVNRAIFQSIARQNLAEVVMVVPESWKGDLISDLKYKPSSNDGSLTILPLPVAVSGNGSLFYYKAHLARELRDIKPDHVFVDEEPWSAAATQIMQATSSFPRSFYTKQNLKKRLPPPFSMMQQYVFAQSSAAYSVAQEVTDVLLWKGYDKPIHYLPHSYDPNLFRQVSEQKKAELRSSLEIPPNTVVIGYFGRVTPEKGIDELLAALRLTGFSTNGKNLFFLCVGNGPMYADVEAFAQRNGPQHARTIAALPHDQVGSTLAVLDVLVLPSRTTRRWKEQFGRILVEAMACGAAVIGSDSGEIPHLISRSGGGLVFHEGDAQGLAKQIETLVSDSSLLEQFKNHGMKYVQENLTHDVVARYFAERLFLNN